MSAYSRLLCVSPIYYTKNAENHVLTPPILCCTSLMAAGRPVTSPLTGAEMGSTLRPNLSFRSLVRGREALMVPGNK